jgi:hypothetical protein
MALFEATMCLVGSKAMSFATIVMANHTHLNMFKAIKDHMYMYTYIYITMAFKHIY